jgi:hypothetical protein
MPIPEIAQSVVEGLPLILVGEALVAAIVWYLTAARGDRRAQVAAWVGLVTVTLWVGSVVAFVLLHAVLFIVGREAAMVGIVATTAFMLAMPFGWAYVIRRRSDRPGGSRA